jgi:hypothetical protein
VAAVSADHDAPCVAEIRPGLTACLVIMFTRSLSLNIGRVKVRRLLSRHLARHRQFPLDAVRWARGDVPHFPVANFCLVIAPAFATIRRHGAAGGERIGSMVVKPASPGSPKGQRVSGLSWDFTGP